MTTTNVLQLIVYVSTDYICHMMIILLMQLLGCTKSFYLVRNSRDWHEKMTIKFTHLETHYKICFISVKPIEMHF